MSSQTLDKLRRSYSVATIARRGATGAIILWSLFPICWVILTSFKSRVDILADPPKLFFLPDLAGYARALSGSSAIVDNLVNSVIVTGASTVVTLTFASLAAFSLSRFRFRGRRSTMLAILASRLLPPISAVVPLFLVFSQIGLVDRHLGLIIIYSALNTPFATWLMKSFFDTVPVALEEAAMIDGTTRMGAFWRITFPLAAPGLVATGLISAVLAWNEFLFAFMFTSVEARTMPVLLAEVQGEDQILWQDMAARATLLMIPAISVGIWMQKHLTKGMTAGSVK